MGRSCFANEMACVKLEGEVRQGNVRVGFEVVAVNGQRAPLASINNPRFMPLFLPPYC